eukprot:CAMPEP_0171522488 /NCGR_PEP_ID=MMETSP0959-20130129/7779_1 /TAXON_ID=87120 /ORGANISM="Aurantiochytrium limacinum, Strain ATCCMYA-1381" /LENGTH=169 /DNA_ID=CAMNT_0012062633 /DNA_START=35 /DNA_END=544 /DNA_ORIENTATION=-
MSDLANLSRKRSRSALRSSVCIFVIHFNIVVDHLLRELIDQLNNKNHGDGDQVTEHDAKGKEEGKSTPYLVVLRRRSIFKVPPLACINLLKEKNVGHNHKDEINTEEGKHETVHKDINSAEFDRAGLTGKGKLSFVTCVGNHANYPFGVAEFGATEDEVLKLEGNLVLD